MWDFWFRSLVTVFIFCLWFLLGLCFTSYTKSVAAFIWFISLLEHKEVTEAVFVDCLKLQNSQNFLIRTINIVEWDGVTFAFFTAAVFVAYSCLVFCCTNSVFHFPSLFAIDEICCLSVLHDCAVNAAKFYPFSHDPTPPGSKYRLFLFGIIALCCTADASAPSSSANWISILQSLCQRQ